jgi:hypothetical protein
VSRGGRQARSYVPISMDVPTLTVDTSDGYSPSMADIVSFGRASLVAGREELSR